MVVVAFTIAILLFGQLGCVTIPALGFTLFILAFRWILRRSTDPFVLIFLTFSIFYIELPVTFMACQYPKYFPTTGLSIEPFTPSVTLLTKALVLLAIFYISFFCAVKILAIRTREGFSLPSFLKYKTAPYVGMALIIYGEIYDNLFSVFVTKASGNMIGELSRFLTNDSALFTGLFLILHYRGRSQDSAPTKKTTLLYFLLAIGYTIFRTTSGSKGSLISLFSFGLIYPLALLESIPRQKIFFPSPVVATISCVFLPFAFVMGLFFRLVRNYSDQYSISSAWAFTMENIGQISLLAESIADRLSAAFNRYILIFSNFSENGFTDSVKALPRYVFENLLNLLLPGTPFPDSYYMSSMQLEKILLNEPFISGDIAQLLTSLNTQPFTAFGICILFAGVLGPLLFFLFIVMLRLLYNKTKFWGSLFSIILFDLTLNCYGLDPAVQNAFVWLCTMLFLSFLTRATAGKSNLVNVKD